eukprot:CAMPEP_0171504864 /NCGR_PEP_ID=MMETSP0958-20121227/11854_1 /TAXON_ID=87120 /ORGANISM="Aurantiochytrium limacinum, Strain ATCCMYA-1381" /LENGTH=74 /DNA_ID=CAMNT_0012040845 /DNA_START=1177 /DNA_END=1401 /DNA_ORIENTATION=+
MARKKIGKTALRLACLRALLKIKNKAPEIHRKLALWLCENYRVILLPKFETSLPDGQQDESKQDSSNDLSLGPL